MKRGKRYREIAKNIDKEKLYAPVEAIKLVKQNKSAKFDETVEVHIRLGIDPRKADQQVRGNIYLPHGTGKEVKIAVFAQGDKAKEASEAGAEIVGGPELVEKIKNGWLDFDVAIATPDMMSTVAKIGKILGTKGLMPSPKTGTVTYDIAKIVKDTKKGRIEYKADRYGIIHLPIGKLSFSEKELLNNYASIIEEIIKAKPATAKGKYLITISLSSTMSPAIKIDTKKVRDIIEEAA